MWKPRRVHGAHAIACFPSLSVLALPESDLALASTEELNKEPTGQTPEEAKEAPPGLWEGMCTWAVVLNPLHL